MTTPLETGEVDPRGARLRVVHRSADPDAGVRRRQLHPAVEQVLQL